MGGAEITKKVTSFGRRSYKRHDEDVNNDIMHEILQECILVLAILWPTPTF